MNKEDVTLLAQLLHAMEEAVDKMEVNYKDKDFEKLERSKREVLDLQQKIDQVLKHD